MLAAMGSATSRGAIVEVMLVDGRKVDRFAQA
jgi:hypothetical protein